MMAASFAGLLDQKTVIISDLSSSTTREIIFETFKKFGCIKSINLDLARRKAFVNFNDGKSARCAQQSMNNKKICGAIVKTKLQIVTNNGTTNSINYQPLTDCKFFLSGNCQKGKTCPYRHRVTSSETVCHLWNNRNCKNLDCAYRHPPLKQGTLNSSNTFAPVNPYSSIKRAQSQMLVPVVKPVPVFKEGMTVEVQIDQKPYTGIVKWAGTVPEFLGDDKFLGIQLFNKVGSGTDGKFIGQRFFTCSEGYGVLIKASICKVINSTIQGSGLTAKKYVCYHYLKNSCMAGEKCDYVHPPHLSTYAWCYKSKSEEDFQFCKILNDEIEKAFCDPLCDKFERNEGSLLVNFNNLDASKYKFNKMSFVRYSTESHVLIPKEEKATKWKWYWLDDNKKWNEYQVAQSATSDMIEKDYIEWMKSGHSIFHCFHFKTASHSYQLKFSTMIQKNMDPRLNTERLVRRRPVYTAIRDISQMNEDSFVSLPLHWPVTLSGKAGYQLLPVDSSTKLKIERKFEASMISRLRYMIISIEEVCNKEFFNKYTSKKKAMKETCKNINELQLWHGTSHTNIEHICHQNFDWRMCSNTASFGQGCYFAQDASYSHGYVSMDQNNVYSMFLADVLVGESAMGNRSYKRPPEKEKFKLYDSCVDNTANPSIYVIFERDQFYPRYILKYKRKF